MRFGSSEMEIILRYEFGTALSSTLAGLGRLLQTGYEKTPALELNWKGLNFSA